MSNSLTFLNKPATPTKTYGPQPKPSTAAPKSAFLDKSNPWAVGKGAPAQPAYNPLPQNKPAPKTQTPAKTQQRAAIPSRGYNYTDASYTGATPQQRAREVDQAQMAAQATRQRREREQAQAQQQPAPIQVAARPPAPMAIIQPAALTQPVAAAAQLAQAAAGPAMQAAQGFVSPLMRRLNSWMVGSGQGGDPYLRQQQGGFPTPQPTPQPSVDPFLAQQQGADYRANQPAPTQEITDPYLRQQRGMPPLPGDNPLAGLFTPAQPQSPLAPPARVPGTQPGIAPTAEQALAARLAQQQTAGTSTAYQLDAPVTGTTPPIGRAAEPPAPGTPAGTNVPTQQPAPPAGEQPPPLFYGYTAPGPLTIDRRAQLKPQLQGGQREPWMTDRPLYTGYGQRAMLSDAQLATEYTQRQRDAAGSQAKLTANYRPWAALTDAEKYQRRFGVMPQGAQMVPDNSTGVAAQAASAAQHDRLVKEYWQKYAPILGWVDAPLWQYESTPRMGRETIQRGPSGQAARQAAPAAPTTKAAPVTVTTTGDWQPTPGVSQEQANVAWIVQHNPKVATTRQPEEADLHAVAREIIGRYVPGIDPSTLTLFEVVRMMADVYKPPPGMEQPYGEDLKWLSSFISE